MEIHHFVNGRQAQRLDSLSPWPADGLVWIDYTRDEAADWATTLEPLLGVEIEPNHVSDSLNRSHRSFFDGTPGYDMLLFEGLGPQDDAFPIVRGTAAFLMFDRALVTIHSADSVSFPSVKQRLADGRLRPPRMVFELVHHLLDTMVDRFLAIRGPLDARFTQIQDALLDPGNPGSDWRALLHARREARSLEALCDEQLEALDAWKRGTRKPWSNPQAVRMRDVTEHIDRVRSHAVSRERDLETAVQLHFTAATERTNRVIQTLTVFSVIFLPLTFIAGIYGMNFEYMPELEWRFGYFAVLGVMLVIIISLLAVFRRRRYW